MPIVPTLRTVQVLAAACLLCSCYGGSDRENGSGQGGAASGVEFADTCTAPPDCGGDPMGRWEVVSGCTETPAAGFECDEALQTGRGTVSGTYTLEEGSYDYDIDTEMRQCGWIDSGGEGSSGSLVVSGNTLELGGTRTVTFCVEGDTLWLYEQGLEYPDLTVMRLERRSSDAGVP